MVTFTLSSDAPQEKNTFTFAEGTVELEPGQRLQTEDADLVRSLENHTWIDVEHPHVDTRAEHDALIERRQAAVAAKRARAEKDPREAADVELEPVAVDERPRKRVSDKADVAPAEGDVKKDVQPEAPKAERGAAK